jgi:ubiquinone/menaquinone biosynthesis C-methylase UbiE
VYARITELDESLLSTLGEAMEISVRDPQHLAMIDAYLAAARVPDGASVLEVGSGSGAVSRALAQRLPTATILGVDPSETLVRMARELAVNEPRVSFDIADGARLPYDDESFDVVVFHRVLCHVLDPTAALKQAHRVTKPGGMLIAFDGDYATITVATGADDPLTACVTAFQSSYINDPWLVRRLSRLVQDAGYALDGLHSHGLVQVRDPDYLLSVVDRGADALAATGRIGAELAAALKTEARRRVEAGEFFGHIAYASVTAQRPVG